MSLSGKITNISCQIDLRAIEPVSNSLIFRPLHRMVLRFMLRKDSISLILGHCKKWVIDVDRCSCTLYSSFLYVITKEKKDQSVTK